MLWQKTNSESWAQAPLQARWAKKSKRKKKPKREDRSEEQKVGDPPFCRVQTYFAAIGVHQSIPGMSKKCEFRGSAANLILLHFLVTGSCLKSCGLLTYTRSFAGNSSVSNDYHSGFGNLFHIWSLIEQRAFGWWLS